MEPIDEARAECQNFINNNPGVRFAIDKKGCAVGIWIENEQRFVEILLRAITNEWVWLMEEGVIHTTLANGQPLYKPEDWEEVI